MRRLGFCCSPKFKFEGFLCKFGQFVYSPSGGLQISGTVLVRSNSPVYRGWLAPKFSNRKSRLIFGANSALEDLQAPY